MSLNNKSPTLTNIPANIQAEWDYWKRVGTIIDMNLAGWDGYLRASFNGSGYLDLGGTVANKIIAMDDKIKNLEKRLKAAQSSNETRDQ